MRSLAFFLAFILANWGIISPTLAQQNPPAQVAEFKVDDYGNFGVGTSWTYKLTTTHGNNENGAITFRTFDVNITKVADNKAYMGAVALYVSNDYLMAGTVAEDGSVIDNTRLMKNGMKVGDSWDALAVETSEDIKATFMGFEDVELPAGKFKAVHVQYTTRGVTMDFWHAPKVGMVKLAIKQDSTSSEQVLQKYTIK